MSEPKYIDAEGFMRKIGHDLELSSCMPEDWCRGVRFVLYRIKNELPAEDVVKVVRCKDCKHRYVGGYTTQYYVCDFMDAELKDEGYCSYGEREDG